jgi:hypothetical protein
MAIKRDSQSGLMLRLLIGLVAAGAAYAISPATAATARYPGWLADRDRDIRVE